MTMSWTTLAVIGLAIEMCGHSGVNIMGYFCIDT